MGTGDRVVTQMQSRRGAGGGMFSAWAVLEWRGKEITEGIVDGVARGTLSAMRRVASKTRRNLQLIKFRSKYKDPGGFGWWREKIPHGFVRRSVKVGGYETKHGEPGAFVLESELYYPIEQGTKRGKRGWQIRGSTRATVGQGRSGAGYTGPRGPSFPRPHLRPAVRENTAQLAAAVARKSKARLG